MRNIIKDKYRKKWNTNRSEHQGAAERSHSKQKCLMLGGYIPRGQTQPSNYTNIYMDVTASWLRTEGLRRSTWSADMAPAQVWRRV